MGDSIPLTNSNIPFLPAANLAEETSERVLDAIRRKLFRWKMCPTSKKITLEVQIEPQELRNQEVEGEKCEEEEEEEEEEEGIAATGKEKKKRSRGRMEPSLIAPGREPSDSHGIATNETDNNAQDKAGATIDEEEDNHTGVGGSQVPGSQYSDRGDEVGGRSGSTAKQIVWDFHFMHNVIKAKEHVPFLRSTFGTTRESQNLDVVDIVNIGALLATACKEDAAGVLYQRGAYVAMIDDLVRCQLQDTNFDNIFASGDIVEKTLPDGDLKTVAIKLIRQSRKGHGKDANRKSYFFRKYVHGFPAALFLTGGSISTHTSIARCIVALSDAFHNYTKEIRTVEDFNRLISEQMFLAMERTDTWMALIVNKECAEYTCLQGKWLPSRKRGEEGWSAGDGDGMYANVQGEEFDVRVNPTDAMEYGLQAGADITACLWRTLWTYRWEARCSRLYYVYNARAIGNVQVRKNEHSPIIEISELLLSLGLTYPYYNFMWGPRKQLLHLVRQMEVATNAAQQSSNDEETSFEEYPGDDDDDEVWQSMSVGHRYQVVKTMSMWDDSTTLQGTYRVVKPSLLFGDDIDPNVATSVDIKGYHQKGGFNIWLVHNDKPFVVSSRTFGAQYRDAWGLKEKRCFLPTWPRDVKAKLMMVMPRRSTRQREKRQAIQESCAQNVRQRREHIAASETPMDD